MNQFQSYLGLTHVNRDEHEFHFLTKAKGKNQFFNILSLYITCLILFCLFVINHIRYDLFVKLYEIWEFFCHIECILKHH